jgi:hypothetical protein
MAEQTPRKVNAKAAWRVFFYASLAAYGVSLLLPAYHAYENWPGWAALLLGFIGIAGMHFSVLRKHPSLVGLACAPSRT